MNWTLSLVNDVADGANVLVSFVPVPVTPMKPYEPWTQPVSVDV